jgi:hypothetical protein
MQALKEVEAAKELMREAANWSVMRWLSEKKRVRRAADVANDALDAAERKVKATWREDVETAYAKLRSGEKVAVKDPRLLEAVKAIKKADDEAYQAHLEAEDIFDRAEKRLSTAMAREGTRKAIASWELHERAIELAEGVQTRRPVS